MDGQRFDAFTCALATGASRRRVLAGLAAGLAALRRSGEILAAPCQAPNVKCGRGKTAACCQAPANGTAVCNPDGSCGFTCDAGFAVCGSACVPEMDCCASLDCPATCLTEFQFCGDGQSCCCCPGLTCCSTDATGNPTDPHCRSDCPAL